jgi:predicted aminopeptidase
MTRQIAGILLVSMLASGCSTIGYYAQAAAGQARILLARQSVDRLIADPATSSDLRGRLRTATAILAFAETVMGLPVHGRFSTYVATGREAVVFNVVAAKEFSLDPVTWCYPVVGCVPYRGYFRQERAAAHAAALRGEGFDVDVGAVPSYSTLGWFSDPLLDTFIDWPEGHLANLLIHELTHGRVWVKGDAVFNESLASFTGDAGARAWLADRPRQLAGYHGAEAADAAFAASLGQLRTELLGVYRQSTAPAAKRLARAAAYDRYRARYRKNRHELGQGRYDNVVETRLNNAYLASRKTYDRHVPAFAALFAAHGGEWPAFFTAVDGLAGMSSGEREAELARLALMPGDWRPTADPQL